MEKKDFDFYLSNLLRLQGEGWDFVLIVEKHRMDIHFEPVKRDDLITALKVFRIVPNQIIEVYDLSKSLEDQILEKINMELG